MRTRATTRTTKAAPAGLLLALLLALLLTLAGCGSGDSGTDPGNAADAPDFSRALANVPPTLKPLYEQGGVLATGGIDAFEQQLADVEGYPAVVNNWASWCGPCRTEWPWFQQAAADHLDRVAFIGVDGNDDDPAAKTFLEEHPIPYPSFADPDQQLGETVGVTLTSGFPNTLFLDDDGEVLYAHQGVYASQADLEADIRKYALD